jgi:hypothetical protein
MLQELNLEGMSLTDDALSSLAACTRLARLLLEERRIGYATMDPSAPAGYRSPLGAAWRVAALYSPVCSHATHPSPAACTGSMLVQAAGRWQWEVGGAVQDPGGALGHCQWGKGLRQAGGLKAVEPLSIGRVQTSHGTITWYHQPRGPPTCGYLFHGPWLVVEWFQQTEEAVRI